MFKPVMHAYKNIQVSDHHHPTQATVCAVNVRCFHVIIRICTSSTSYMAVPIEEVNDAIDFEQALLANTTV